MTSISDIQTLLRDRGLYPGKIDNSWGPVTQRAMDAYRVQLSQVIPSYLKVAAAELSRNTSEIPGPRDNPRIVEYHQTTGLAASDDETPWCSSFVNWCMDQIGGSKTGSALARSWLQWGGETKTPVYGAVAVLSRPPSPTQGHVGFLVAWDDDTVFLLGGNQRDRVCVQPFPRNRVIQFRRP